MEIQMDKIANCFNSLGSQTRLSIYLLLIQKLPSGLNIGEIQEILDIKPSTLAHHLKNLVESNLIFQEKKGKEIYCFANKNELLSTCNTILEQCCKG